MKKIMKRVLLIIIVLLTVSSSACSQNNAEDQTDNASQGTPIESSNDSEASAETLPEENTNSRENTPDSLPADLDFGGATVTVLHRGGDASTTLEVVAEEYTADIVASAIYNRNVLVEDRLKINIESITAADNIDQGINVVNQVRTAVQADSDDFNVFANHMSQTTPLILEGSLMNIYNEQYLDWEQPWWNQSFTEQIMLDNKLYFAVGELSQTMIRGSYAMFVNKDLFETVFHDEDIYQVVNEGKWTLDKLKDYSAAMYNDSNGDLTKDADDIFGFTLYAGPKSDVHDAFTGSCDIDLVVKNADGVLELAVTNERTYTFLEELKELYYSDYYTYVTANDNDAHTKFINNTTLFTADRLEVTEKLRDMEADYGIIPVPKLNEDQADYSGFTHNGFSVFCVPITANDRSLVSAFLEAMCAESYRSVTPAYYEVALKQKYARDEVVSQMLDMITSNIRFDFGFIYSASLNDLIKVFRNLVGDEYSNPASQLKSTQKSTAKLLENLVADIEALED